MKNFTTFLKEYREKHKISIRTLAELLHVSPSTLVRWLQGNPPHTLVQKEAIMELEKREGPELQEMEVKISKIRSKIEPFYDLCVHSLNKVPDAIAWTIIVNPVIATWETMETENSKLSIHYKEPRHIKTEVSTKEFKKFSGITTWEEKNLGIKHHKIENETVEFTLQPTAPWTKTLNLETYKSPLILIPHFQNKPNAFIPTNRRLKTPKKPHCIYPPCKTCWQTERHS
jgi:transcriptional regulator with XRE-family HTH domain